MRTVIHALLAHLRRQSSTTALRLDRSRLRVRRAHGGRPAAAPAARLAGAPSISETPDACADPFVRVRAEGPETAFPPGDVSTPSGAATVFVTGSRYLRAGDYDLAWRNFAEVATGAADPVLRAEAVVRQAFALSLQQRWEACFSAAHEAIRMAHGAGAPHVVAMAQIVIASISIYRHDVDAATEWLTRAASTSDHPLVQMRAAANLAIVAAEQGEHKLARASLRAAYRTAAAYNRALSRFLHGRREDRSAEAILSRDRQLDARRQMVAILMNYGRSLTESGNPARAIAPLERAVRLGAQHQFHVLHATGTYNLAFARLALARRLLQRGDRAAAEARLVEVELSAGVAYGQFSIVHDHLFRAELLLLLGEVGALRNDHATAREMWTSARQLAAQFALAKVEAKANACLEAYELEQPMVDWSTEDPPRAHEPCGAPDEKAHAARTIAPDAVLMPA